MVDIPKATQSFVPIQEIRGSTVVLKDRTLRGVLLASSLNFALKSQEEQSATILQFQNLLNTIDFSIQFYVQSRKRDIRPYLALLEEQLKEQAIDVIKTQTAEYIEFVRQFTENVNIMSKSFFIVVPYTPALVETQSGSSSFFAKLLPGTPKTPSRAAEFFEEHVNQLEQRIAVVEQGLSRTGIRVARLGTTELVELYYKIFNPGDLEKPIQLQTIV